MKVSEFINDIHALLESLDPETLSSLKISSRPSRSTPSATKGVWIFFITMLFLLLVLWIALVRHF